MIHRFLKTGWKAAGLLCSAALLTLYASAPMRQMRGLPDVVYAQTPESAALPEGTGWIRRTRANAIETLAGGGETLVDVAGERVVYRLFGKLPVRVVQVVQRDAVRLVPGGSAVGITIRTQGVLIVGLGTVDAAEGALSPGSAAGLRPGDVILAANGRALRDADDLIAVCAAGGESLRLTVDRDGTMLETDVPLVRDKTDGKPHIGLWVRDSTAGVGTLSFYDPETGWFAALGHAVSDVDTQSLLSVREGKIIDSEIVSVRKGEQGSPGELIGVFSASGRAMGTILKNTEYGIFGQAEDAYENELYGEIPMAYGYEAHTGSAELLATVSGEGVQAFDCQVLRVNAQQSAAVKGMIVEVTDPELLEQTGGIVQGMSGCPVVQDGKLIGVVTHVFVNDPTRGYCIYAEWMREITAAVDG